MLGEQYTAHRTALRFSFSQGYRVLQQVAFVLI